MSLSLFSIPSASVTIVAAVKLLISNTLLATVVEILVVPDPVTSPVNVIVGSAGSAAQVLSPLRYVLEDGVPVALKLYVKDPELVIGPPDPDINVEFEVPTLVTVPVY